MHDTFAKVYCSKTFSSNAEKEVVRSRISALFSSPSLHQVKFAINRSQVINPDKIGRIEQPNNDTSQIPQPYVLVLVI